MNSYIQVSIAVKDNQQSDILIALLADFGFEGFEERPDELMAFIKEELFLEDELKAITAGMNLEYSIVTVQQQNWNAAWESSFQPVTVGNFAIVRAAFHQPTEAFKHDIIITPKMSFGTGHHATTYMMIQQMEGIDFTGKTVLDFGTGTAVLAILSEKMGAASVVAIDNDDWSIDNAKENIIANGCNKITLVKAETIGTEDKYDIILANINLNVILANMQAIDSVSNAGGQVLLSGFLKEDEEKITRSLSGSNLSHTFTTEKNNWLTIRAIRG